MRIFPASQRRRWAFCDSGAYLALLDRRDEHHAVAVDILTRLADGHYRAFTTNAVVYEAYSLILSAMGRDQAFDFLIDLKASQTVIVRVRGEDERRAEEILRTYDDKDFSLVDALSFAVIERLRIPVVFAFDRHFTQYGLTVLTPEQF